MGDPGTVGAQAPAGKAGRSALVSTIERFQRGEVTAEAVVNAYYECTRVTRIIVDARRRARASTDYDHDLKQEVGLLLATKFVFAINDPERIYNVLHLTACNIARRHATRADERLVVDLDAMTDAEGGGSVELQAQSVDRDADSDSIIARVDLQRAFEVFERCTPPEILLPTTRSKRTQERHAMRSQALPTALRLGAIVDHRPIVVQTAPPKVAAPQAEAIDQAAADDGRLLNEIRVRLGLTVPAFAAELGISKGTLASYLYGVVRAVPKHVMATAQELAKGGSEKLAEVERRFGLKPMSEIVDDWLLKLEIGPDDRQRDTLLGQILQVDRATVWRWRAREMRPDVDVLLAFDDAVNAAHKARERKRLRAQQAAQRRALNRG